MASVWTQQLDEGLTRRSIRAIAGGAVYYPTGRWAACTFGAMGAELEADVIRLRTREALAVAGLLSPCRAVRFRDPAAATR